MEQLNLSLTLNANGSITANWSSIPGATRYHAYMYISGEDHTIYNEPNLTTTSYTSKPDLEPNEIYKVTVVAYGASGSLASDAVRQLIPSDFYKNIPLNVPANIEGTAYSTSVKISFDKVPRANSYDILFNGTVYSITSSLNRISKEISNLKPNTTYTYSVRAKNTYQVSEYSRGMTIKTALKQLAAPTNITKAATQNSVTISWKAVSGATGYEVVFRNTTYRVSNTSITLSGLSMATTYQFKIRGTAEGAEGIYTNEIPVTTAPQTPSGVTAVSTDTTVTVKWNAVRGATGYLVFFIRDAVIIPAGETSYTFTKLQPGTSYVYKVCAVSADGESPYSAERTIKTLGAPPMPPADCTSSATENSVTVTWSAVDGAVGYEVFFDGKVYETTKTSKTFTGLSPNKDYPCQVRAKGADGRKGEYSEVQTVRTTPLPPASKDISVSTNERSINLSWTSVNGATSYDVFCNGKVYHATGNSLTIDNLASNTDYSCQVRANNADGSSSYGGIKHAKTTPLPPSDVRVAANKTFISVSWSAITGATSYDVMVNGTIHRVTGLSKQITGLIPGKEYEVSVRVNNADGSSSFSEVQRVTTLPSVPSMPINVTASSTINSVTVSWKEVPEAASYDVMLGGTIYETTGTSIEITGLDSNRQYSYQVRAKNISGTSAYSPVQYIQTAISIPANVKATATQNTVSLSWERVYGAKDYTVLFDGNAYLSSSISKTFTGLKANTSHSYCVRANGYNGSSAYSEMQSIMTLPYAPAIPSNVNASATADTVTISWSAVAGADSYEVLFNKNETYTTTSTSVVITGLRANTSYNYQVRAKNAGGVSGYSALQTVKTALQVLTIPSGVTATATSNSITVKWNSVAGATNYDVKIGDTVYVTTMTSKTITGLKAETNYTYQVRAKNATGISDYSPVQTIKTLMSPPAVPTNVKATATINSVTVSWDAVTGARRYTVKFNGKEYGLTGTTLTFNKLQPNTSYTYAVCAENATTKGKYSVEKTVHTLLNIPTGVRAEATGNTITLSWNSVDGATAYGVLFNGLLYTVTETSKTFTGLEPLTAYKVAVKAKNEFAESQYTREQTVRTTKAAPPPPSNITAVSTLDTVIISWDPVSEAKGYDVEFDGVVTPVEMTSTKRKAAARSGADNVERVIKVFSDLKPNTEYAYRVRSKNEYGIGEYSPLMMITTQIYRKNGLPDIAQNRTYPDGRLAYTGLDPINVLTGAFLWSYSFLRDCGKDELHFVAMYDSQRDCQTKTLGRKWTHSFGYELRMDEDYAYFCTPQGNVIPFQKEEEGFLVKEGMPSGYTMQRQEDRSYLVREVNGREYVFDENLRLRKICEGGLERYRLQRDQEGKITDITGRCGGKLTFGYSQGKLAYVSDLSGSRVRFGYENENLVSVANGDGNSMTFAYDDYSNLVNISDFAGNSYIENYYDVYGKIVAQRVAEKGMSFVSYDVQEKLTTIMDEEEYKTRYYYDENLNITRIEREETGAVQEYNEFGQIVRQTDALGHVTEMFYDERGRMNHVVHPDSTEEWAYYNDNNYPVRVVNRDATESSYSYDDRNNLISVLDERGNSCSYQYDEADNLTAYTDREGNVWSYLYDDHNHLKQTTDPEGNSSYYVHDLMGRLLSYKTAAGKTTTYEYAETGDLLRATDSDGSVVFERDSNGNCVSITDKRGNKQRLEYNNIGKVATVTDRMGNRYQYEYGLGGNLVQETDPLGYHIDYEYDARRNVVSLTDKNNSATRYTYDAVNQLVQVQNALGGITSYGYDSAGRVVAVIDPLEHQTSYAYDDAGRLTQVTNAMDQRITYTYDQAGNLLSQKDQDGMVTSYAYDKESRLITVETPTGSTHFTYDSLGRVISVKDVYDQVETVEYDADGNPVEEADKEGNTTSYGYDEAGRISERVEPDGGKTAYRYDQNGNCISITNAENHVYAYEYNANDQIVKVTDPMGHTVTYEYDACGRLASFTDANGGTTTYTYDGNGNLIQETNPLMGSRFYVYDGLNRMTGSTDEEGYHQLYTYDAAGNLSSYTDANENIWTYEYDAAERLTSVTDQNGDSLAFAYTDGGKLTKVTDPEGAETNYIYDGMGRLIQMSDALERSVSFTYDNLGRMTSQTDADGSVTEYTYSPTGNLLSIMDGEGNTTQYTYNSAGQVLTETDALGHVVSYEYDLLGQVKSITDALNQKRTFTYTANGQIATVTDAMGGVTQYVYDGCGNLVQKTDPLGNTVNYEYDAMNNQIRESVSDSDMEWCTTLYQYDKKSRLVKEINPVQEEKAYTYDGNGNYLTILDEEKQQTTVRYDLNNKPVFIGYGDGKTALFRYNKRGELVEMTDWNGVTVMERDTLGRLTGVTDFNGHRVGYSYNARGDIAETSYPDGSRVGYTYDRCRRLTGVAGAEGVQMQCSYDQVGNLLSLQQPGSSVSYSYNAARLPVEVNYQMGDGTEMSEQFSYDPMGRITGSERSGNTPVLNRSRAYAYDAIGQLISVREGAVTEAYGYDRLGNRTSRSINGLEKTVYQYDAGSRMTELSENGILFHFQYDKRGNLTEERKGDNPVYRYLYDATNHMVMGKNMETGERSEYVYNALSMKVRNVRKTPETGGYRTGETTYVPDYLSSTGNELMRYEKGFGAVSSIFGQGYTCLSQKATAEPGSQPTPRSRIGTEVIGRAYFQPDLYGSPLFATNGQGEVLHYGQRDAWGGLQLPIQGDLNLSGLEEGMQFTSYNYDPVIQKHFAKERFYDSIQGRMLSPDPVRRGPNGYVYCGNDPVNYTDETGEIANILAGGLVGAAVGGAFGFAGSAVSQLMEGKGFDLKKALGSAANGAVTGGVKGALVSSGAGFVTSLLADFAGGAVGSSLEQWIGTGKINPVRSIAGGLTNAVSGAIFGNEPFKSAGQAFRKGAAAGAVTGGINNLADALTPRREKSGSLYGISSSGLNQRDPKALCGETDPLAGGIGYSKAVGYQYGTGREEENGFSLGKFCKDVIVGGITGGLAGVTFYKADKTVEALKDSVRGIGNDGSAVKLGNIGEVRYREGRVVDPIEVTYDMRLNPEKYVYAVANKYGINLRGSGLQINIKFDPYHTKGPGVSRKLDPTNIVLGPQALISEEELARTISHELNHARSWLRGGDAPESTARAAENALGDFINGGR